MRLFESSSSPFPDLSEKDLVMGIVAGTLFWQQSDNPQSVMGILFQACKFMLNGQANPLSHV
jgi:hypothetical protein